MFNLPFCKILRFETIVLRDIAPVLQPPFKGYLVSALIVSLKYITLNILTHGKYR